MNCTKVFLALVLALSLGGCSKNSLADGLTSEENTGGVIDLEPAEDLDLSEVAVGDVVLAGTGCSQGTADVLFSPETLELSARFSEYIAQAGHLKTVDRKTCSLAIPLHLPEGLTVSIVETSFLGYNSLPLDATSTFTTETFFSGAEGEKLSSEFIGGLEDLFVVNHTAPLVNVIGSECKQDVILRINSALKVRTNTLGELAMAMVDSANLNAGLIYKLHFAKCGL